MSEASSRAERIGERRAAGRHAAGPYAVAAVAVLLVYANALSAQFVADDPLYVTYVARARTAADVLQFFTVPLRLDPGVASVETLVYRPMYLAYGALAYHVWGTRPWAWHAANIALHVLGACLVLVTLRRLFGMPPRVALLACLLWAVHPVQVEAVTFITACCYLLMGVFLLVAVLVTCGWWPASWPWPARALVAAGAFTISVLSHELGLMAPALAALVLAAAPPIGWAWGHRVDRGALAAWAAMALAAAAYIGLRLTLIGTGAAGHLQQTLGGLGSRLLQAPEILLRYLALLAVPGRLTLDRTYDVPLPAGALDRRVLLAWGVCAVLVWGLLRIAPRAPLAPFGLAWFLLAYFPVSNTLIPLYSVMGERYLYVASLGVIAGGVALGHALVHSASLRRVAALLGMLLLAAYGARTAIRNQDWQDDLTFSSATVAASPQSAYMWNNLGNAYRRHEDLDRAEQAFRAAVAADPTYYSAHVRLGNLALQRGRLNEAESWHRKATRLRPDYGEGYYGLALVALRRGQQAEMLRFLARASALVPAHIETDLHLGLTYLSIDPARAAAHLRRFVAQAPEHPQAAVARARLSALLPPPTR
jgi:tetratricopeptide (TPR) repeat protein